MLNEFMKVAYANSQAEQKREDLHRLLMKLPNEDLYKLATGSTTKEALLEECKKVGHGGENEEWIDRFKGSPLFDQAIALAQEEIQVESDEIQKKQEDRIRNQAEGSVWDLKDQLRLKKKLLELQLAQAEVGGEPAPEMMPPQEALPPEAPMEPKAAEPKPAPPKPAGPEAGAQGAGALGSESPNPEKTVTASAMITMADRMGRDLAKNDFNKEASNRMLLAAGDSSGRVLTKIALDAGALKGLGQGALGFLKANKGAAIGAAVGAAGGLAHGLQKDPVTGQRSIGKGLLEGAAGGLGGAAVGHGVQHFAGAMKVPGATPGEALKATGRQLAYQGEKAVGAVKGALSGAPAAAPGGALGTAKTVAMGPKPAATLAGSTPMNLNKPAPMGNRIPTGMINGQSFQNPMAPPNVGSFG